MFGTSVQTPPKKFRNIPHQEQEISLHLSNFGKEVSQLTDWQSYKKFQLLGNGVTTSKECVQKFQKDISSGTGYIPIFV